MYLSTIENEIQITQIKLLTNTLFPITFGVVTWLYQLLSNLYDFNIKLIRSLDGYQTRLDRH